MENNNNPSLDNIFNLGIDVTATNYLKVAATWARIIAIMAFVSAGLSVLSSFFTPSISVAQKAGTVIATMIVGAISVVINLYLYRFATQVLMGLNSVNQSAVTFGINNLRIYFKILGILLIIFLSLFVLGLLLSLLFFGLGSAMR